MRARASLSSLHMGYIFSGFAAASALLFIACGPSPVVVTDADQALLVRPNSSASAATTASAAPTSSAKKDPLLVPDQAVVELPPFSCPPNKQFVLLGQTFCINLTPLDWHEAEAQCQKIGAHLATMKNSSLPNALREAFLAPASVDRFWIGLAEPNEGRWIWSDGTPMRFAAFAPGEPNNSGRGEDCAEWLTGSGRWNDVDCFTPRHFLCEAPTPPAGSRAKGLTCNGKQFTIGKNDYCVEAPATWEVAQKACLRNGGELAKLDTEAENTTLFKAIGIRFALTNLWIGLSDEASEGNFRWISGDPLEVPMWRQGEPNNVGEEDCTEWVSDNARWNDLPCATKRPSLCEKPQLAVGK
jgi:hypothetical protein